VLVRITTKNHRHWCITGLVKKQLGVWHFERILETWPHKNESIFPYY
jgi:hypothetical protein